MCVGGAKKGGTGQGYSMATNKQSNVALCIFHEGISYHSFIISSHCHVLFSAVHGPPPRYVI
jgi:hypothetical protein